MRKRHRPAVEPPAPASTASIAVRRTHSASAAGRRMFAGGGAAAAVATAGLQPGRPAAPTGSVQSLQRRCRNSGIAQLRNQQSVGRAQTARSLLAVDAGAGTVPAAPVPAAGCRSHAGGPSAAVAQHLQVGEQHYSALRETLPESSLG